jgi:putative membrane protein
MPVLAALGVGGIGLIWASLFHVAPMALNAHAWRILHPRRRRPPLSFFIWIVWIREAVNGLLPVARIGGEIASVRLLICSGVRTSAASAGLVIDMTLSIASQFVFTLIGVGLLITRDHWDSVLDKVSVGLTLMVPIIGGLFVIQRAGAFGLLTRLVGKLFRQRFTGLTQNAANFDRTLGRLYSRRRFVVACGLWQLIGWIAGAGEIWLTLRFLGHGVGFDDALLVEALIQAVSSSVFLVPSAIGIQEGVFPGIAPLIGLTSEVALALALARRVRDIVVFAPALLAWQIAEGRRFVATAATSRKERAVR